MEFDFPAHASKYLSLWCVKLSSVQGLVSPVTLCNNNKFFEKELSLSLSLYGTQHNVGCLGGAAVLK